MIPTNTDITLYAREDSTSFGVVKTMDSLLGSYPANVQLARDSEMKSIRLQGLKTSAVYKAYIDISMIDFSIKNLSKIYYDGTEYIIRDASLQPNSYIKIYFSG